MISELPKHSKIYMIGICGTAMASLAGLLLKRGFKVTGSDQHSYPPMSHQLQELGISYYTNYDAKNIISEKPDYVIVGNVVSKNHPEAMAMIENKFPYTSLPKALGELYLKNLNSIVIAGTHGKTTTTSLMSWLLTDFNQKPGFLIGGIAQNFNKSFQEPEGKYFVIEGDEYDTAFFDKVPKFTHYYPKNVILTSIEFDHADIYSSLEQIKEAFKVLINLIPEKGNLIFHGDDINIVSILNEGIVKNKISYGYSENNQYQIRGVRWIDGFTEFEVFNQVTQLSLGNFLTRLYGKHNILNVTASLVLGSILGFSNEQLKKSIPGFKGVKRRQELLGEFNGVTLIEDFAHHPTAVYETLNALKMRYPCQKIYAIFEPRSATSRRNIFQQDYINAFLAADAVFIKQAFDQTKINQEDRMDTDQLAADIKKQGVLANSYADVDQIVNDVTQGITQKSVIVVMSNGGFDGIYEKLKTQLTNR